jgi:hypothetical protein
VEGEHLAHAVLNQDAHEHLAAVDPRHACVLG